MNTESCRWIRFAGSICLSIISGVAYKFTESAWMYGMIVVILILIALIALVDSNWEGK